MRLLPLLCLLSSAATAAEPYTSLGRPCALIEERVPVEVLYFSSFLEAFKDVLVRDSRDPLPRDEAAASKRLCGDEGCPGLMGTHFTPQKPRPAPAGQTARPATHGIIFGDGPGLFVLPNLGWAARSPCDGTHFESFQRLSDTLFLVRLREADGDTSGGYQSACLSKRNARSVMLVDLKARKVRWLAQGLGPSDVVMVRPDGIHATLCGQPERVLPL